MRCDKPLLGTGGVPFSELFRCLSGEVCSWNSPSTCSIFSRSSALSCETCGGSRGSRLDCRVSSAGHCRTADANPISFEFVPQLPKYTPARFSVFQVRMRITSRGDADSDRDRVFIAPATEFRYRSRVKKEV